MPDQIETAINQKETEKSEVKVDEKNKRKTMNQIKDNTNNPEFVDYPNNTRRLRFKTISHGNLYRS